MVTFSKIQDAQLIGEYSPTSVDDQKGQATIRLLQVAPKIVDSKIPLKGVGIKLTGTAGRYQVSDAAWVKLQAKYSTTTDF